MSTLAVTHHTAYVNNLKMHYVEVGSRPPGLFASWISRDLVCMAQADSSTRDPLSPGSLRGAFNDYRAGREDVAQDEADKDHLIECPTLVLWGEDF
jgi:hypothetical protein